MQWALKIHVVKNDQTHAKFKKCYQQKYERTNVFQEKSTRQMQIFRNVTKKTINISMSDISIILLHYYIPSI
jgi:hypothetical protein